MSTFEIVLEAENVDTDLEKIGFMAGEIVESTSGDSEKGINLYACMIIDYVVKAQETLKKIIDQRGAGKHGKSEKE